MKKLEKYENANNHFLSSKLVPLSSLWKIPPDSFGMSIVFRP